MTDYEAPKGEVLEAISNDPRGMNVGQLVNRYAKLRDELSERRKDFKSYESDTKNEMEVLEGTILEKQRALGVESVSSGDYTAFQTKKRTVRVEDWDRFGEWILETGNIHCVEKRSAKNACIEINEDEGLDLGTIGLLDQVEIVVQVRKK